MPLAGHEHRHRPVERLPVDHRGPGPGREPEAGDVAEPIGMIGVGAPHLDRLTRGDLGQRGVDQFGDRAVGGGNRIAMGIEDRIAERGGHPLDQGIAYRVLEPLRLLVHNLPAISQEADQIGLENPVTAHHAERQPPSVGGELDTLVRHVLQQSLLGEPLDHPADGGCREPEVMGDVAGSRRLPIQGEPVDGLEIVFHRLGQRLVGKTRRHDVSQRIGDLA